MEFDELMRHARLSLDHVSGEVTPQYLVQVLRKIDPLVGHQELMELVRKVHLNLTGMGPLHELFRIPGITDILVNRHNQVWIDSIDGLQRVPAQWSSEAELREFASRLVRQADKKLDRLMPFADFELINGARCNVIIPPLSASTHICIRIPVQSSTKLVDLLADQDAQVKALLDEIIALRQNILITGGTGTGKTTLLASIMQEVEENQRLVVIEDTCELRIDHPNTISLQSRQPNIEGVGAVSMSTLVRQALRMRPDRIIIGEVRGSEIAELFLALNTGHSGSAATLHANSIDGVLARVQSLASVAGIPPEVALVQFNAAFDAVIHLERLSSGRRVVSDIAHLSRNKTNEITLVKTFSSGDNRDRQDSDKPLRIVQ